MSIAERAKPVGQLDLPALLEIQRPHVERITLELGGKALFVDAMFVLCLRDDEENGKELGITRDVRVPITLARKDDSARTYGFVPRESDRVFATLPLGLRPSRPFIFINDGHYQVTFERDDKNSLSFTLRSKDRMIKRSISGEINHKEFMRNLLLQGRLSLQAEEEIATEEDVRARMEYQARLFLEHQRNETLTPQWRNYGQKHADEIARYVSK